MLFNENTILQIFHIVASILWLGNIEIDESTLTDENPCSIVNKEIMRKVCLLL